MGPVMGPEMRGCPGARGLEYIIPDDLKKGLPNQITYGREPP